MIGSIAFKEMKVLLKDKGLYFWLFGLPILFIVIFNAIFSNTEASQFDVHYIDLDQTEASEQFLSILDHIEGFEPKELTGSVEEELDRLKSGELTVFFTIPAGFDEQLSAGQDQIEFQLYYDGTAEATVAPILAILQQISSEYREEKLSTILSQFEIAEEQKTAILSAPIKIIENAENATKINAITQYVPGYTVMFVFFIMISMVTRFLKDRNSGVTARLRSTQMRPLDYLIGMWIPNILVVMIQSFTLLIFGFLVYDLHLGDLSAIILIILLLSLCGTSFGLALSMLVNSENLGVAVTQLIAMGGAIVAGLWFPYEFMPTILQNIGKFTPQYWAQTGLQDVMIRNAHIADIWPSLLILASFSIVAFAIALIRFPYFMYRAVK